jgi:phage virion morphogenesis protein
MINFEINYTGNDKVQKAFEGFYKALSRDSQRGILARVGHVYLAETEKRFEKEYDPDRKKWKKLSPTTVRLKKKGDGRRGPGIMGPTHRGVWTGDLATSLKLRFENDSVLIGSDLDYAPWFHYGVKNLKKIGQHASAPWGPIPARRFLGRNNRIDQQVIKIIHDELAKKMGVDAQSTGRDYL